MFRQMFRLKHSMSNGADDPYHVDIIREKLVRTLPAILPDVFDELLVAIPEYIPATGDGMYSLLYDESVFSRPCRMGSDQSL